MNAFYFCYFCIYFYSWERKISQHVQRQIFINLWYFHLLVIGHLKHIGLSVWSPETCMSSGGFSFLLFKDQEMKFFKRNRSSNCHFYAPANQKCLKYIAEWHFWIAMPPTKTCMQLFAVRKSISPFGNRLNYFHNAWNGMQFQTLSKWPVLPWFYFSCRSTVYSVYILCDLASLWIEMIGKMNHCLKQIRCQT